jgi:flagellar basal-body rod protein FlgC
MSLFKIFDIAGSAMSAQSARLSTTASNLANANTVASSAATAYRARQPVFQTVMSTSEGGMDPSSAGVRVAGIVESTAEPAKVQEPGNPLADENGYIYMSNVNPVDELVNMITASRSYQNSVEVLSTSKELLLRTLSIGQ